VSGGPLRLPTSDHTNLRAYSGERRSGAGIGALSDRVAVHAIIPPYHDRGGSAGARPAARSGPVCRPKAKFQVVKRRRSIASDASRRTCDGGTGTCRSSGRVGYRADWLPMGPTSGRQQSGTNLGRPAGSRIHLSKMITETFWFTDRKIDHVTRLWAPFSRPAVASASADIETQLEMSLKGTDGRKADRSAARGGVRLSLRPSPFPFSSECTALGSCRDRWPNQPWP
jgi:hypothetical protein